MTAKLVKFAKSEVKRMARNENAGVAPLTGTACDRSKAKRLARRKAERQANVETIKANATLPDEEKKPLPHPPKRKPEEATVTAYFDRVLHGDARGHTFVLYRGKSKFEVPADALRKPGCITGEIGPEGTMRGMVVLPVGLVVGRMSKEFRVPY